MCESSPDDPLNVNLQGVEQGGLRALLHMDPHMAATIVIVEDHATTRQFLADNLAADGYEPVEAATAREGRRLIADRRPDLAILDLGLPDRDGLALLTDLRERGGDHGELDSRLPILIVSGRAGELDRIRGLDRGADDFLAKPFSYGELRSRVGALLRRSALRPSVGRLRVGTLELDPLSREVWVEGRRVRLANKEFALLHALAAQPTRTFSREELLREVWGFQAMGHTRTLDSHASRLRRKLAVGRGSYVVNVWAVGYRLIDGEAGP